jgi:putative toxin-antitoxin system antitoxin component (TIGR02293 family)
MTTRDRRIIRVTALAEQAFGSPILAENWLNRPLPELDGKRPLDLMEQEDGLSLIRALLLRTSRGAALSGR